MGMGIIGLNRMVNVCELCIIKEDFYSSSRITKHFKTKRGQLEKVAYAGSFSVSVSFEGDHPHYVF